MARKLAVEAIGTFFLLLVIGQVVIGNEGAGPLAPLAIAGALMVMVYAGGHISGAHYNPAITLAVWMRGKATSGEVFPYWIAQLAGAALAVGAVRYLKRGVEVGAPAELEVVPALVAEFLFTFALAHVVLNVATAKGTEGNSNYGLAIGFTVLAGAYAVGGISGGAFNPAVAMGIAMMGLVSPAQLWIFLVANFAGAACAAVVFNWLDRGGARPLHVDALQEAVVPAASAKG